MAFEEQREALIGSLISEGHLKTDRVIAAFREVPRENFVPANEIQFAYSDYPLDIGFGQTISAPHMVAIMTELLKPKRTDRVLEIGSGSGYQAAILSRLVASVTTVELEAGLAAMASENLGRAGIRNVRIFVGDGSLGHPQSAPYDKIAVTCATPEIFQAWKDQVSDDGIILAPVGGFYRQELTLVGKKGGEFFEEDHGPVIFVPLRH